VALNWVRQRHNTIPIIGARKLEQLKDNMACLEWTLSDEQLAQLDDVSAIELGFPHDFLNKPSVKQVMWGNTADSIVNHRTRV
jgi:diketogulonate reductase-like aldo/keto reductase